MPALILKPFLQAKNLKVTLNSRTIKINTSAAPQPCECADSYGWDANLHILRGKASTGSSKPVKNRLVPSIVIIRGAVSPAILETARTIPVSTPPNAVLRVTCSVIFHLGIPKEYPASLTEFGTTFKLSSVTLTTIGIMIIDNAKEPAQTEKEPSVKTITIYPTIPRTIEGSPVKTSLKNLIAWGKGPFPANSAKYIPATTPTGAATMEAMPTVIKVP